ELIMLLARLDDEDINPLRGWELEAMVRGFFARELLLGYTRFFVLFETDPEKLIKKIAGHHQFHAVRDAVRATIIAASVPEKELRERRATYGAGVAPGSKNAGVGEHTPGPGQSSVSRGCAGTRLRPPVRNTPTAV